MLWPCTFVRRILYLCGSWTKALETGMTDNERRGQGKNLYGHKTKEGDTTNVNVEHCSEIVLNMYTKASR